MMQKLLLCLMSIVLLGHCLPTAFVSVYESFQNFDWSKCPDFVSRQLFNSELGQLPHYLESQCATPITNPLCYSLLYEAKYLCSGFIVTNTLNFKIPAVTADNLCSELSDGPKNLVHDCQEIGVASMACQKHLENVQNMNDVCKANCFPTQVICPLCNDLALLRQFHGKAEEGKNSKLLGQDGHGLPNPEMWPKNRNNQELGAEEKLILTQTRPDMKNILAAKQQKNVDTEGESKEEGEEVPAVKTEEKPEQMVDKSEEVKHEELTNSEGHESQPTVLPSNNGTTVVKSNQTSSLRGSEAEPVNRVPEVVHEVSTEKQDEPPIPVPNNKVPEDVVSSTASSSIIKTDKEAEEENKKIKPVFVDHLKLGGEDEAFETQSTFFSYFVVLTILAIVAYLVFHNKKKILALLLEGRRKNQSGRRHQRSSSAQYRKLDNNLEEAMGPHSDDSIRHVIY